MCASPRLHEQARGRMSYLPSQDDFPRHLHDVYLFDHSTHSEYYHTPANTSEQPRSRSSTAPPRHITQSLQSSVSSSAGSQPYEASRNSMQRALPDMAALLTSLVLQTSPTLLNLCIVAVGAPAACCVTCLPSLTPTQSSLNNRVLIDSADIITRMESSYITAHCRCYGQDCGLVCRLLRRLHVCFLETATSFNSFATITLMLS